MDKEKHFLVKNNLDFYEMLIIHNNCKVSFMIASIS